MIQNSKWAAFTLSCEMLVDCRYRVEFGCPRGVVLRAGETYLAWSSPAFVVVVVECLLSETLSSVYAAQTCSFSHARRL